MEKLFNILIFTLLLTGCNLGKTHHSFPGNMEPVDISLIRFDNDLLNVNEQSAAEDIRVLYDLYPEFMPVFVEHILGIPVADTAYLCEALPRFLQDTTYGFMVTNQREQLLFAKVDDIENELSKAFTRIHYLWPDWEIPGIYLFISGFNASIFFTDEDMAIGADMYLGSDYEYYNRVVHEYQKYTMRKECIAADVVSAYLFRNIAYTSRQNRLLDNMLYRGKIMYLLSVIMDWQQPCEIMGYTREKWRWCERNERAIWNAMMDRKDLFKTDNMTISSYLNDGPFTSEISQDSPARLGTWIGWQVIESYMQHNPDVTLQNLMQNGDSQEILENSYYRP